MMDHRRNPQISEVSQLRPPSPRSGCSGNPGTIVGFQTDRAWEATELLDLVVELESGIG